ncbi:MAG: SRPBCC family protein [Actinomycetia bacterium]|nr:SRPBCC family protein [Actinomycetes bacterium]
MEMMNSFVVSIPVDESWLVLTDLERIAPCMPGAKLNEVEGNEYRGVVKVKVGPIAATYEGKATFVSLDAEDRVAVIKAFGRDLRQGNADAVITATLSPNGDSETTVDLVTDLSLSGKLASFGKSGIEDVAANVLRQFADNLEVLLAAEPSEVVRPADSDQPADGPRPIDSAEPEPMDLASVAMTPVLKRALPLVVVALVVVVVCLGLKRRRR